MNESFRFLVARRHSWGWLAVSVVLFGALMAFRSELHSVWLGALVAGVAFAFLYPVLQGFRRRV